jgi:hypothetical protein
MPRGSGNRLLATLPAADFDLLMSEFEDVALDQDAVLLRAGAPAEHLIFPHSGAISLMAQMANGQAVATARRARRAHRQPFRAVAVILGGYRYRSRSGHRIADSRISILRYLQRRPAIRFALQIR